MSNIELWQELSSEPQKLLNYPLAEAEQIFNRFTLEEQASLILLAPWEKRYKLIMLSSQAPLLVQSMPVQELFWTVKSIGPQDSLDILRMALPEQIQFMFDLDWWCKDQLVPEKIAAWILILMEAGIDVFVRWLDWLRKEDDTLFPDILRHFIKAHKRPDDMDVQEARDRFPPFTLDDIFYIEFRQESLESLWSRVLNTVSDYSIAYYRDLMEAIVLDIPAENHEFAYRWKKNRLADYGVPDYYESLDIYAPIDYSELTPIEVDSIDLDLDYPMPAFVPTLYIQDMDILGNVLASLADQKVMSRIITEWVWVTNKLLVANLTDLDDPNALKNALLCTAGFLNIALEIVREKGDIPEKVFATVPLEQLVRLGYSSLRGLRAEIKSLLKQGLIHEEAWYLPEEYQQVYEGLSSREILYWDDDIHDHRCFRCLAEIDKVRQQLYRLKCWAKLMSVVMPHWSDWEKGDCKNTNIGTIKELTWPMALATLLARAYMDGAPILKPLNSQEVREVISEFFDQSGVIKQDVLDKLTSMCFDFWSDSNLTEDEMRMLVTESLSPLGEEVANLPRDAEVDTRFLGHIWTVVPNNNE